MKRKVMVATAVALLCAMSACGGQELVSSVPMTRESETSETYAVLTDPPSETLRSIPRETEPRLISLSAEKATEVMTTTTDATEATTEVSTEAPIEATTEAPTEAPEPFELSDEEVADKMHEYFAEKGYSDAQIAGIVGNAEIESGLEPSRGISGGGFGLFQLMDCPQRRAMFGAFDAEGVGKYTTSQYWGLDESDFDNAEDFDKFMTVMLDYTMNPDDPTWMSEIQTVDSPEAAAEVFLVHYERAINGGSQIEYYAPYAGRYYQATESRREAARRWYEYFTA